MARVYYRDTLNRPKKKRPPARWSTWCKALMYLQTAVIYVILILERDRIKELMCLALEQILKIF